MALAIESLKQGMGLHIVSRDKWIPDELRYRMHGWQPNSRLGAIVKDCLRYLPADLAAEVIERITQCVIMESSLAVKVRRGWSGEFGQPGSVEDYGITSRKKVTTAGVTALCAAWGNAIFDMKYMALGTGSGAEANTETNLATEIAANHYTSSVRVTCTHVESTNTVPIVGTHTQATAGDTIAEHGIFSSSTQGATGLWDRSLTGSAVSAVARLGRRVTGVSLVGERDTTEDLEGKV